MAFWAKNLRHKKLINIVLALLLAVGVVIYLYKGKTAVAPVGATVKVERGKVVSMVSATGTISPVNLVDISSKISGLIKEMKVKENDQVTVGQVLLVLDDTHLRAMVDQAQARLNNVAGIYERTKKLEAMGAVATQALDTSRSDYSIAQASYNDAISQLNDTVIRSPINGQVIGKPTPAGQAVAPGVSTPMVLLTVADMSLMQIETQVDESDIGKMQVGLKATFTVDAYPEKIFSGVVSRISQKANIVSNVVYYKVLVDVDAAENLLKPTMTARVSINVAESKNTLTVPLTAVKSANGSKYVVVVKDGKNQNTTVITGITGEDRIEILSGLGEDDQVLASTAKTQMPSNASGAMMPRGPAGL
ncbi:MAG: efflux RND transporter periplasmic adaptor subunit [Sporomusaceae bacterium]|nr:efflux RND transporter periplasmic adaptor subunit [Sporomusaceae bacterium]